VLLQLVIWHPAQIIGDKSLGIAYVANNFGVYIGCLFLGDEVASLVDFILFLFLEKLLVLKVAVLTFGGNICYLHKILMFGSIEAFFIPYFLSLPSFWS